MARRGRIRVVELWSKLRAAGYTDALGFGPHKLGSVASELLRLSVHAQLFWGLLFTKLFGFSFTVPKL